MDLRQLDIPATSPDYGFIPREFTLNNDDFIHFIWPEYIDPSRYTVVVESLDTSEPLDNCGCLQSHTFRAISKLAKDVEIPRVKFGWHPKVGVVPDSPDLPSFQGILGRMRTYQLPNVKSPGTYKLIEHGLLYSMNSY